MLDNVPGVAIVLLYVENSAVSLRAVSWWSDGNKKSMSREIPSYL